MEVTRELVLPAAPDEVWEELTDPARLEEWFATEVELDLEEGEGHFRWENGEERHAVVETLEEGRHLGYTWIDEDGRETQVDFTIEEVEDGTRVVVTETAPVAEWGTALELHACCAEGGYGGMWTVPPERTARPLAAAAGCARRLRLRSHPTALPGTTRTRAGDEQHPAEPSYAAA